MEDSKMKTKKWKKAMHDKEEEGTRRRYEHEEGTRRNERRRRNGR